ncbi:hypothetical protein LTR28_000044, partial [Elasticomyces elasticus]
MSSAAPESSTAKMAATQPLEKSLSGASSDSFMPGQFPETPAKELSQFVGSGPVKGDVPGGAPEMPAKEAKDFAVNPIPASEGSGNPIKLAPGEKVPDIADAQNKIKSTVYDDPELKSAFERGQADAHKDSAPSTEATGSSLLEQAKDKANQAYGSATTTASQALGSVASVVGLGGKGTEGTTSTTSKSVTEQAKDTTSQAPAKVGESVKQPSDSVRSATGLDGKSEESVPASTDKSLSEQAKSTYDQVSARATETANQASAQVKDTAGKAYGSVASATGFGSKEPENEKSTGTTAAADTEQTYG